MLNIIFVWKVHFDGPLLDSLGICFLDISLDEKKFIKSHHFQCCTHRTLVVPEWVL